ncbi:MAG: hypothetical protein ACOCYV_00575 [Planctomycetota bacterium]
MLGVSRQALNKRLRK